MRLLVFLLLGAVLFRLALPGGPELQALQAVRQRLTARIRKPVPCFSHAMELFATLPRPNPPWASCSQKPPPSPVIVDALAESLGKRCSRSVADPGHPVG